MTGEQVMECMNNSWRALARIYAKDPDNSTRIAMNIIARILGEVESAVKESHREKEEQNREGQITIEEWIAFLSKED